MELVKLHDLIPISNDNQKIHIGINYIARGGIDIDVYMIALNENYKVVDGDDIVYYKHRDSYNAMYFTSDSVYYNYDESFIIEFNKLPKDVEFILVGVSLYPTFGRNMRLSGNESFDLDVLDDDGEKLMHYYVTENLRYFEGAILGLFERNGNHWAFEAQARGTHGSIQSIPYNYGLR
jgi:stress response protein SCP2